MGKDSEKLLMKAEKLYKAMQYKKAAKIFNSLGTTFLEIKNFELAKNCFFNATTCYVNEEKYELGVENLRSAGNASLLENNLLDAQKFFIDVLEYIPNLRKNEERNFNYVLFSCLAYLCSFVEGKHEEGIKLIKKIKSYIDDDYFKENPLIRLIKDITIAIKDKSSKYLEKIEKGFDHCKFRVGEIFLAKLALVIVQTHVSLKTNMTFDKNEYTTHDIINLKLEIDTKPLVDMLNHPFYNYQLKEIKISKIGVSLSDNLISHKRTELPVIIKAGQPFKLELLIKPHFQVENSFIGPIKLTSELDGNLIFSYEINEVLKPKLISPLPTLDISIKNLRPPLIGTTFPMEILIENKSEGEALEIFINTKLPEQIKLIRGILKKQVYSLELNKEIKWEISLKPLEAGDYIIELDIEFIDPDGNKYEEIKKFPLAIKL